ncbi:MAG: hypothetical protein PQJ58_17855 [Spirochaetales bacterium]|nr:hypothetical protein [Spirochaetales bacterium]
MTKEENREFVKKVEQLVQPEDVNAISFLGDANKIFPLSVQQAMVRQGNKKGGYMGFIVEPYCFFLAYEITDEDRALQYLPPDYELVPIKLFEDEPERNLLIVGTFSARTSAFTGVRSEFYLIARNKKTAVPAWMIIGYETNTNSYDPGHGFTGYSIKDSLFTTTPYGELLVHLNSKEKGIGLSARAQIKDAPFKPLGTKLWLDCNFHTDYASELKGDEESIFSLVFDPVTMKEALYIAPEDVQVDCMNYFNDIIDISAPVTTLCFPYSQHYFIESLNPRRHSNTEELEETVQDFLKMEELPTMKAEQIKKPLFRGILISMAVNTALIAGLIIALILK